MLMLFIVFHILGYHMLLVTWMTEALGPLFTDFTWGAGGSTSELTLKLTSAAKNEFGTVANMHLTCTNQSSEMTGNALKECRQLGVRNIVALRGDPPVVRKSGQLLKVASAVPWTW